MDIQGKKGLKHLKITIKHQSIPTDIILDFFMAKSFDVFSDFLHYIIQLLGIVQLILSF